MKYAAQYNENTGFGFTLEEAYDVLCDLCGYEADRDETAFYEVTKIQVEFKITKKETPIKVKKVI